MLNLGLDLSDLTESTIFSIALERQKIKLDVFSLNLAIEGK